MKRLSDLLLLRRNDEKEKKNQLNRNLSAHVYVHVPVYCDCTVLKLAGQSSCQEEVKRSKALRSKVLASFPCLSPYRAFAHLTSFLDPMACPWASRDENKFEYHVLNIPQFNNHDLQAAHWVQNVDQKNRTVSFIFIPKFAQWLILQSDWFLTWLGFTCTYLYPQSW